MSFINSIITGADRFGNEILNKFFKSPVIAPKEIKNNVEVPKKIDLKGKECNTCEGNILEPARFGDIVNYKYVKFSCDHYYHTSLACGWTEASKLCNHQSEKESSSIQCTTDNEKIKCFNYPCSLCAKCYVCDQNILRKIQSAYEESMS